MYPSVYKNVVNALSVQDGQIVRQPVNSKQMRRACSDYFMFLMTNIALVKMYIPLCGSECEFSNGVVPGNVEQVSCVALQRLKTVLCSVLDTQSLDLRNYVQAMLPALHGKEGIVKMATGAGKSLCMFMVPLAYSDAAVGPPKCTDELSGSFKILCT